MYKILNTFSWYLFRKFTRPIESQLSDYLKWKGDRGWGTAGDEEYIQIFLGLFPIRTIEDITDRHVKDFAKYVLSTRSRYAEMHALRAMRCFLRYHKARKVACMSPKVV